MQIETATKYTFVGHEIYFRGVQNILSYSTRYTFVWHKIYFRAY